MVILISVVFVGRYKIVQVSMVNRQWLKEIERFKGTRAKLQRKLETWEIERKDLVVPIFDAKLEVRVVSIDEFKFVQQLRRSHYVCINGQELIINSMCGNDAPGIVVFSSFKSHPKALTCRLTYKFCQLLFQVYGFGFGDRSSSKCSGLNSYRGMRHTKRSGCTSVVANEHVAIQQYTNRRQSFPLCQLLTEKICNNLGKSVETIARHLHPDLMDLVGCACTKSIMTCGAPVVSFVDDDNCTVREYNPRICLLGFCNEPHIDCLDDVSDLKPLLREYCSSMYAEKVVDSVHMCVPTSCSYQICWSDETKKAENEEKINQLFALSGVSVGVMIEHGITNSFLGSSFTHFTCVPHADNKDGDIWFSNKVEEVGAIFAWGQGGGKKELRYHLRKTPERQRRRSKRQRT